MKHQTEKPVGISRRARAFLFSARYVAFLLPALAALLLAGCGPEKASEVELQALAPYLGEWEGEDGTMIAIRKDGSGNFESGSTRVTGGTARVDEQNKRLTITGMLGINGTWVIDEPPHIAGGIEQMKLDGMVYRRSGGFSAGSTVGKGGPIPPDSVVRAMVTATLLDLNTSIVSGNYKSFYATIAPTWQTQTSPEAFREAFKELADQKIDYRAIANYTPVLDAPPALDENGLLVAGGHYNVSTSRLDFTLKYLWEDSQWLPFATQVNLRKLDAPAVP